MKAWIRVSAAGKESTEQRQAGVFEVKNVILVVRVVFFKVRKRFSMILVGIWADDYEGCWFTSKILFQ